MLLKTAQQTIARRTLLARGGSALAALALLDSTFVKAFAEQPGEVIPWLDQSPPVPPPAADAIHNLQALGGLRVLHYAERQILQHRTLRPTSDRRSELVAGDRWAIPATAQFHIG